MAFHSLKEWYLSTEKDDKDLIQFFQKVLIGPFKIDSRYYGIESRGI
jgi:hypothetical protein